MKHPVDALRFGVKPDTGADMTLCFRAMLADKNPDREICLQPGQYDFFPQTALEKTMALSNSDEAGPRKISLFLENLEGVTLRGEGARLVFHGQLLPIAAVNCRSLRLENFSIDWDIPLTAEGVIEAVQQTSVDVSLDSSQFPHQVRQGTLYFQGENWEHPVWGGGHMEFEGDSLRVAYRRGDRFSTTRQESLPGGRVRFWGDFSQERPKPGNILVLRHGPRIHPGILLDGCDGAVLEDVHLHGSGGLGILAQFSRDLRFTRVSIAPNRQRFRRCVSSHDDGIHLSNDGGTVVIEDCLFQGLMDDPVNLHGTAARMEQVLDSRTVLGRFVHPQSQGFPRWAEPGQEVAFLSAATLETLGRAAVESYCLESRDTFRLTLKDPLPPEAAVGDALENRSRTPSLVCRGNHFGGCRARGLLVCTPQPVLVERNFFESSGAAILIAGDASDWYECGGCTQVEIRDNVFSDACLTSAYEGGEAVITIHPHIAAPRPDRPYHRNISIHHNLFHTADTPVLYAHSVQNLEFRDNQIFTSQRYAPWNAQKTLTVFDSCTNLTLAGNHAPGKILSQREEIPSDSLEKTGPSAMK